MRPSEDLPGIPWATHTKVRKVHRDPSGKIISVEIGDKNFSVEVDGHGGIGIAQNSKNRLRENLDYSKDLTRRLRHFLRVNDIGFNSAEEWIERRVPRKQTHRVFTWNPDASEEPELPWYVVEGKKVHFGRSGVEDGWIGSDFDYLWFKLYDDKHFGEEGIAIDWERRGNPDDVVVYVGDVEEFFLDNTHDEHYYPDYDLTLENGILWAMDFMGVFDGDEIPSWVVRYLVDRPDLFWHDLAEKLAGRFGEVPKELYLEARKWLDEERRSFERGTGQLYFWPGENDDG